jgi:hypothetical protein
MRDIVQNNTPRSVNGVMNAVEVDVANLRDFLRNSPTGQTVESVSQNGYILYFSDRRGMLPNPNNGNLKRGEYGFEDLINAAAGGGLGAAPDLALEPLPPTKTQSPEDVNANGILDNFGAKNLGLGFKVAVTTNPYSPRIDCPTIARKNWVSGARPVLKLVDGDLGRLPAAVDPNGKDKGGFTVASENPVYIQGDYNSNSTDPTWANPGAAEPIHASAAVIADAVTLLSNAWTETTSLNQPSDANSGGARPAARGDHPVPLSDRRREDNQLPQSQLVWRSSPRLRNRRRPAQLPALPGKLEWRCALLQGVAGELVLFHLRHRHLQVLRLLGLSATRS